MRKEQLVRALVKTAKQNGSGSGSKNGAGRSKRTGRVQTVGRGKQSPKSGGASDSAIARKLRRERNRTESLKNLALVNKLDRSAEQPGKDRVIVVVRDPYWLQAYWEITESTVTRAQVALGAEWYGTQPVLRLLRVSSDSAINSAETMVRQIPIHGGVRNWFIDVPDPPSSYRLALGYATASGKFHLIAKSNLVTTPTPDHEAFDHNWVDIQSEHKRFYAMSGGYSDAQRHEPTGELKAVFEEKLRRPMNVPAFVRMGNGINNDNMEFDFEVDAHLVVHGKANPDANVTLAGEPVELRSDGSFSVRMELPDKRQVLPIVASSRDGTQKRTTVLAVERNTKVMEPVSKQLDEV